MSHQVKKLLEKLLGPQGVADGATDRALYSRDMMTGTWLAAKAGVPPKLPDLVVWPTCTREVSEIVRIAHRHKTPVIPFGAGSGVSGGTLPLKGGIILDLKKMDRIESVEWRRYGFVVTAEVGILGEPLERGLNERGYTLGHFPSSILCATLGGYIAARSAGQLSSRYGKIEDMVEDIEAVLPTGEIIPFGGRIRSYPGLRPKDLLVGSEGTLGVVTRARLKIHPQAPASRYRGITFNRLESGLAAIRRIMQSGLRPSVIRLYDPLDTLLLQHGYETEGKKGNSLLKKPLHTLKENLLHTLLRFPEIPQLLIRKIPTDSLMILGFEGDRELIRELETIALKICQQEICRDLGEGPGLHWLKHRYSVSFKMPALVAAGCFVDTIEVAATWDRLVLLYRNMQKVLQHHCLVLAHFSHAYPEGCSIYFTIIGRTGSARRDYQTYQRAWREAMEGCLKSGGTISHHHGIGILKAEWLPRELGGAMPFFKAIKKRLDPKGIMNPGKMGL